MKAISLRDRDLAVLLSTFRRFPSVREVRVFGSRATGKASRASDLDLAIFAPEATAAEWAGLCEALENAPLIYELDVVRPERTTNDSLRARIEREGVRVYPEETRVSGIRG
ncbi:MAG: nucleotidyltransferase family protein [Pyrinomonadaceae bacterium]